MRQNSSLVFETNGAAWADWLLRTELLGGQTESGGFKPSGVTAPPWSRMHRAGATSSLELFRTVGCDHSREVLSVEYAHRAETYAT
jgi:hypothetical protein